MKKVFILGGLMTAMLFHCNIYAMANNAECACVMNAATGELVFEKNAYEKHAMASTTKIMTAIVALENSDLYDVVEFSKNAEIQEGSGMYAKAGQQFYMEDMLYGLMLNSGNDAAMAIAEHVAGSPEAFADMMNDKAWHMGAGDTAFCNPSGLDQEGHYTTARDLAYIARYAMQNDDFCKIVATEARKAWPLNDSDPLELYNHNKLLSMYDGCIGIKTGYTSKTGRCLVSAAERDGMTFIAVTLDDKDDWEDHMQMLDDAFATHYGVDVVENGQILKMLKIGKKSYPLIAQSGYRIASWDNKDIKIEIEPCVLNDFTEDVQAGEKVGYASILCNGEEIQKVGLLSRDYVEGITDGKAFGKSLFGKFYEALKYLMFN